MANMSSSQLAAKISGNQAKPEVGIAGKERGGAEVGRKNNALDEVEEILPPGRKHRDGIEIEDDEDYSDDNDGQGVDDLDDTGHDSASRYGCDALSSGAGPVPDEDSEGEEATPLIAVDRKRGATSDIEGGDLVCCFVRSKDIF
jgi:hypothetical protein